MSPIEKKLDLFKVGHIKHTLHHRRTLDDSLTGRHSGVTYTELT